MKSRSNQSATRNPHSAFQNRGFTMIELLVAVTILVVMLLMFAMILTQSQKVVSGAERMMRRNAAAMAIKDTFREDIRRATKHGFLCITQGAPNSSPMMLITTAGPTPSKTHGVSGSAGMACFGLATNHATNQDDVLFYQRWVLKSGTGFPGSGVNTDIQEIDLADLQVLPRHPGANPNINDTITTICDETPPTSDVLGAIWIPPRPGNSNDVGALWQVLATDCQYLSIMWTDGKDRDNNNQIDWYGVDFDGNDYVGYAYTGGKPNKTVWRGNTISPSVQQIEFQEGGCYRALWTHEYQNNWPKAIRIRFSLGDDPNNLEDFEVICPVGR